VTATERGREVLLEGRRRRVSVIEARLEALGAGERALVERAIDALEKLSRG
jgi:hypothetical protein